MNMIVWNIEMEDIIAVLYQTFCCRYFIKFK